MKHLFTSAFLLLALLLPATASAHDFEVDGIYYDINGNEATVTCSPSSNQYSGVVEIPAAVTYNGTTYSVTAIGNMAFYGCSGLTDITIPNSVTSIGELAFCGCISLADITLGNSVTIIGNGAFSGCTGLADITLGNFVTTIGIFAFDGCTSLTTVTLPNSVTSIGDYAFNGCSSLTSINIPSLVTIIGPSAFEGCISLTNLVWNARNCSSYGDMPTANIEQITIGEDVEVLPGNFVYAFIGCLYLSNINVANNNPIYDSRDDCNAIIETATNTLLFGCKSTVIPNSVTTIGESAFCSCSGLTSITIPNSVTTIGEYAFCDCGLTGALTIPNSVTTIGESAFMVCNGITSITIGSSVTTIGEYAFASCSGLSSITVESGNPIYDSRDNCNAIIETASNTLIAGCMSTTLHNSVAAIGGSAFSGCTGLTSITIPNSVRSIGHYAFSDCNGLTDVYSYITDLSEVSIGSNVFYLYQANYSNRRLHVLYGMSTTYQADSNWGPYFGTIVEMDPVPATSIELNKTAAVILEGETLQLTATVVPDYTTNKTINWYTSNPAVATVNENGLVTACGLGTATITAVTTDGSNLSASCTVTVKNMSADNCFVLDDASVLHGETITIPVQMNNVESIMAFQTDICLPDGFTLVTNEDNEPIITPSSRLTSDHVIMADQLSDGSVRVICYTPRSKVISGNEGDLFYITIAVPDDAGGDYTLYLRNSLLTTTDYEELNIPDAGAVLTVNTYIPGDVNDSHTVNVTDIVVAAQYILQRNPDPFIFEAADMNGDGNITVTDIMLIARLIMTPPTNAPKRMPAITANDDRMSSEAISLATGETRTVSLALDNAMDYSAFQLDLNLPDGLTARNFQLTDRAGNHAFDVDAIDNGKVRVLCYSPAIDAIDGNSGALLTFDVTATGLVTGNIMVDGIEFVTTACQPVLFDAFTIGVDNVTAVSEVATGKIVARVDYYNLAGQRIDRPESGVTLVVTTYTDGTRTTTKHLH